MTRTEAIEALIVEKQDYTAVLYHEATHHALHDNAFFRAYAITLQQKAARLSALARAAMGVPK